MDITNSSYWLYSVGAQGNGHDSCPLMDINPENNGNKFNSISEAETFIENNKQHMPCQAWLIFSCPVGNVYKFEKCVSG